MTESLGSDNQMENDNLTEKDIQSPNRNMSIQHDNDQNQSNGLPKSQSPTPTRLQGSNKAENAQPDEILVEWDEKDPMNPHSMSKARRWLIVLIVSLGSLCVYVYSRHLTYSYPFQLTEGFQYLHIVDVYINLRPIGERFWLFTRSGYLGIDNLHFWTRYTENIVFLRMKRTH